MLCVVGEYIQRGSGERLCVIDEDLQTAVKKGCAWSVKIVTHISFVKKGCVWSVKTYKQATKKDCVRSVKT